MELNKLKQAFDRMNLSEEKKEQLWKRIDERQKGQIHQDGKLPPIGRKRSLRYAVAAAMVLFVIAVTGWGINAATNGALASAIRQSPLVKWMGFTSSEEIVNKAGDLVSDGTQIYAPEILYVDEETLVFGNLRGILIYDRKGDQVAGTIDTQAIDCIYFEGGESKDLCRKGKGGCLDF